MVVGWELLLPYVSTKPTGPFIHPSTQNQLTEPHCMQCYAAMAAEAMCAVRPSALGMKIVPMKNRVASFAHDSLPHVLHYTRRKREREGRAERHFKTMASNERQMSVVGVVREITPTVPRSRCLNGYGYKRSPS